MKSTGMSAIVPGMRVADMDPALAAMRAILGREGNDASNTGTVREVDGDTAYVIYDDGQYAPCPVAQLLPLTEDGAR